MSCPHRVAYNGIGALRCGGIKGSKVQLTTKAD